MQAPFKHMPWPVVLPAVHDGAAPQAVEDDLLLALHTGAPVEQSIAPVWHAVLMPVVHAVPAEHALHMPALSHTPGEAPAVHEVPTAERVHVPVEQE